MIRFTLLLFFALGKIAPLPPQATSLHIQIHHAASDQGLIRVLIFAKAVGFPDQPDKALKSYSIAPKNKSAMLNVSDLPAGVYSVAVIHDEDKNGKLNTNAVGYPTEKFGFSNNPKILFSAPSFDKAAFEFKNVGQTLRINLN
jgi:uncharacterized protein (DUF2141 family)